MLVCTKIISFLNEAINQFFHETVQLAVNAHRCVRSRHCDTNNIRRINSLSTSYKWLLYWRKTSLLSSSVIFVIISVRKRWSCLLCQDQGSSGQGQCTSRSRLKECSRSRPQSFVVKMSSRSSTVLEGPSIPAPSVFLLIINNLRLMISCEVLA